MYDKPIDFSQQWLDSDTEIFVEDEALHVHKAVLILQSPVFKKMLCSEFKEKVDQRIALPGKTKASVVEMLKQIYPNPPKFNENSDIEPLLKLAREYQIDILTKKIEKELLRRPTNIDTLVLAQEFSLDKLAEKCISTISRNSFNTAKHHPKYKLLSSDNIVKISEAHINFLYTKFQINWS
ncbi:uncharacterized protein LOC101235149 isoform X1 [Hydra vulgaris]|uniref:uncharacterized protein LOC101235149 isoform X1 n=1 Tax=Hydra vulgaris TaxID=6087 RepID=UPI0002B41DB7|nr:BTB/POZ domain-containing protein At4g08455 [Hydra vulgaris]